MTFAIPGINRMILRSVLSIFLFVLTYILLICSALGLIVLFALGGIMVIRFYPSVFTVILGIGLIGIGLFVMIFLVKFIFQWHKADQSHLIEVSESDQPELFKLIREVVSEVKTDFPHKVYLSSDVNASVFYNSGFWSMFFPVRKNLMIGLGLVNAVSETELKAILGHEFGHFSQRSMKVGSYVYYVNQVIHNVLFDNKSLDTLTQKVADIHNYFGVLVLVGEKIIHGMQWVLAKVYTVVNLNYMLLSREMEFQADESAARVAGPEPLAVALLRMDFANYSYQAVLSYYNSKIPDSIKTLDVYPQYRYVLGFLAKENKLPLVNGLPHVDVEHRRIYNKSRLVIKDQWASHPDIEDRVERLRKYVIKSEIDSGKHAAQIFRNLEALHIRATARLFDQVVYPGPVVCLSEQQFIENFVKEYSENTFHQLFNAYYDHRNPVFSENGSTDANIPGDLAEMFGSEPVSLAYTFIALENDMNSLNLISQGGLKLVSFDYAGKKYAPGDCVRLMADLSKELLEVQRQLDENDSKVYRYFHNLAAQQGRTDEFKEMYAAFLRMNEKWDEYSAVYINMVNASLFVHQPASVHVINASMSALKKEELLYRENLVLLLNDPDYQSVMKSDARGIFAHYLSKDWLYYYQPHYYEQALTVLFESLEAYKTVLSGAYFAAKKALLDYKANLFREQASF